MTSTSGYFACPRSRTAFTLVELMMVVGITSVLAGLVSPAVISARRIAVRVACANNLRQLGTVAIAYAGDNDGQLPAAKRLDNETDQETPAWFFRLPQFIGRQDCKGGMNMFQCAGYHWTGPRIFENATPKSFKMNGYLEKDGRPRRYVLGSAGDEAGIVLFMDGAAGETGMGQWGHAVYSSVEDDRHGGMANFLYCDGHTYATARPKKGEWGTAVKWKSEDWPK